MSCGVGHGHSSDLVLLWLWRRPAAVALIGPLAWEPPCTAGVALKRKKKKSLDIAYSLLVGAHCIHVLWGLKHLRVAQLPLQPQACQPNSPLIPGSHLPLGIAPWISAQKSKSYKWRHGSSLPGYPPKPPNLSRRPTPTNKTWSSFSSPGRRAVDLSRCCSRGKLVVFTHLRSHPTNNQDQDQWDLPPNWSHSSIFLSQAC